MDMRGQVLGGAEGQMDAGQRWTSGTDRQDGHSGGGCSLGHRNRWMQQDWEMDMGWPGCSVGHRNKWTGG